MRASRSQGAILGFILCWGVAGHAQPRALSQEGSAPAAQVPLSSPNPKAAGPASPLPDAPSQVPSSTPKDAEDEHIFHIVPTVDITDPHYPVRPLTTGQKLALFANHAFDRFTFVQAAASAGIGQALDTPAGYGQGAEGFGRRYGAAFASHVHHDFFTRFALPSLLRQDPRYFRRGQGVAGPRLGYALSRVVVTQGDNGERQFNFSQVLGSLFSAALTNAYYPEEERTAGRTFARAGRHLVLGAGLNVLKEFWPQLRRKMLRRKNVAPAAAAAPATDSSSTGNSDPPPR